MKRFVGLAAAPSLALAALISPAAAEASYTAPAPKMQVLYCGPYGCYGTLPYLAWTNGWRLDPSAKPYWIPGCAIPGTQVGQTSQCVAFARTVTGAPPTGAFGENWFRGRQVVTGGVQPGTLIATFQWNGTRWVYSGHCAVFAGYRADGALFAWSQNWPAGFGCVVFHVIGNGNGGVTDPRNYYLVE